MQGKITIVSGEAAKGLIGILEEISKQNAQLLANDEQLKADNEEFRRNDEQLKADNAKFVADDEEFRKKLAEPRTVTERIKSWWRS